MKVSDLMTRDVASCKMTHSVACSAQIMWDRDCGCVPIVDDENRVVGMITDRDICMTALSHGLPLSDIPVHGVASTQVIHVSLDASIEAAEALMQKHQFRRLPVVDREGKLRGIISMNDIARQMERAAPQQVAQTLAAISRPHASA